MLLQMHDDMFRLVVFFSKKISLAECNYMIYSKKLLAIVKSFKTWKPELTSIDLKKLVKMYTDHKNFKHFMTTKQLNCQQAWWAKFLLEFNFKISYRPGKQEKKLDVLTRHSQDLPKGIKDSKQQHQFQTLLQNHQLDKDIKKALAVTFCVNMANKTIKKAIDDVIDKSVDKTVEGNEKNKEIINVKEFSDKISETLFPILLQQIISVSIGDGKSENDKTEKLLEKLFEKTYEDDEVVKEIIDVKAQSFQKLLITLTKKSIRLSMSNLKIEIKQLYVKNRMYIPENEAL